MRECGTLRTEPASWAVGVRVVKLLFWRVFRDSEKGTVFFGQTRGPHLTVHVDVLGESRGQEFGIGRAEDLVGELGKTCVRFFDEGPDYDPIVEAGGAQVAAIGLNDSERDAFLALQVTVMESVGLAPFDSREFHPDEIVGVVDNPHLVGFCISHP